LFERLKNLYMPTFYGYLTRDVQVMYVRFSAFAACSRALFL